METVYIETTIVSYLVVNPHIARKLRAFMEQHELVLPEICTPVELMGESRDEIKPDP